MKWRILFILLALGLAVYYAGVVLDLAYAVLGGALLLVAVFGEVTVHGVEGLSVRLRLARYSSSVLVNSIAVLPELFTALALGSHGVRENNLWLVELAILSVLVSASFNLVVLGVVGLCSRGVGLETDMLRIELPLMRVAAASTALLVGYAVIEASLGAAAGDAGVRAPYALLVAQLVFWLFYLAAAVRAGLGRGLEGEVPRYWLLALAGGIGGMLWAAEGMAGAVEALVHELHIEHLGEAALAVGIASSSPETVLAILSTVKGQSKEAAGGLLAATSTALLFVYPLAFLALSSHLRMDAYVVYMLAMLSTLLWVAKRSLAHENRIDESESLYILVLSAAALATLAAVK